MRLPFESVSEAFLLQGHPWKCWMLIALLKHVLASGVGSTAISFLPQFFFFTFTFFCLFVFLNQD